MSGVISIGADMENGWVKRQTMVEVRVGRLFIRGLHVKACLARSFRLSPVLVGVSIAFRYFRPDLV